ncbi:hypothetical protein EW146_g8483 [Bondarzewia mesenterica]|uniref:Pentacotripeptide-repeat region of PRORP domain-containing protein n=1 Tax=Bondarzewia mesenterica TaxID=1095465 RepID=A0A4S4LFV5_9AGAM|nr:hypothetical protein EW146_g8483 [Bondarzewia mesenterica]
MLPLLRQTFQSGPLVSAAVLSRKPTPSTDSTQSDDTTRPSDSVSSDSLVTSLTPEPSNHYDNVWVKHFELSLRRFLSNCRSEDALEYFHLQLSNAACEDRTCRFAVFELAISMFLQYSHYQHALDLYDMMFQHDLWPSALLRAKVKTVKHAQVKGSTQSYMAMLVPLLALKSFEEQHLRRYIDFLTLPLGVDFKTICAVVEAFVHAQKPGYELRTATLNKLICFSVRSGHSEVAEHWLNLYESSPDIKTDTSPATPYTTIISELADNIPRSLDRINAILARMNKENITPDLPLFNTLIRVSISRRDLLRAFALYDYLITHRLFDLIPDAFTFCSLFKALSKTRRMARVRRVRISENARSPRQLYNEMIACHLIVSYPDPNRPSRVIQASTLNVALRTFMLTFDYQAAYVTLQAFRTYHISPDAKTFHSVVVTLLAHMHMDLDVPTTGGNVRWLDRFVGREYAANLKPDDISDDLLDEFLLCPPWIKPNSKQANSTKARGEGKDRQQMFTVPSRFQILGIDPKPPNSVWDIGPLNRLLRRAIFARFEKTDQKPLDAIESAVEAAKKEMVPVVNRKVRERLKRMHEVKKRKAREAHQRRLKAWEEGK